MSVAIRLEPDGHPNQDMGHSPAMQRTTEVSVQKNTDSVVHLVNRTAVDNTVALGGTTIAFDMLTDR